MAGHNSNIWVAEDLLQKLGLSLQTADKALLAISFPTTRSEGELIFDTLMVRPIALYVSGDSVTFCLPPVPVPVLDHGIGMKYGDRLQIAGVRFYEDGKWEITGSVGQEETDCAEMYFDTNQGTLRVEVIPPPLSGS